MKKILLPLLSIGMVLVSACDDGKCTINGKIQDDIFPYIKGSTIYVAPASEGTTYRNSMKITEAKFKIKEDIDTAQLYVFAQKSVIVGQPDPSALFIAEPGKIRCTLNKKGIEVEGSPLNDSLNQMHSRFYQLAIPLADLQMKIQTHQVEDPDNEQWEAAKKDYYRNIKALALDYYHRNITNPIAGLAIRQWVEIDPSVTEAEVDSLIAAGGRLMLQDPSMKTAKAIASERGQNQENTTTK